MGNFMKLLGLLTTLAGLRLFIKAPAGVNGAAVGSFSVAAAGILLFIFSEQGQGRRGRALKLVSGVFFFILGLGGLFALLFALLEGEASDYLAGGALALVAGLAGTARSLWGQAGDEALDMAPRLGFTVIEEDSDYAAQGILNGVATAYNLGTGYARHSNVPRYWLNAACNVPNQAGLAVYAYNGGPGARPAKPLPPLANPAPDNWEEFAVHCSREGADLRWMAALRAGSGVFGAGSGLTVFELEGQLLKVSLGGDGELPVEKVRGLLDGISKAAAALV